MSRTVSVTTAGLHRPVVTVAEPFHWPSYGPAQASPNGNKTNREATDATYRRRFIELSLLPDQSPPWSSLWQAYTGGRKQTAGDCDEASQINSIGQQRRIGDVRDASALPQILDGLSLPSRDCLGG